MARVIEDEENVHARMHLQSVSALYVEMDVLRAGVEAEHIEDHRERLEAMELEKTRQRNLAKELNESRLSAVAAARAETAKAKADRAGAAPPSPFNHSPVPLSRAALIRCSYSVRESSCSGSCS